MAPFARLTLATSQCEMLDPASKNDMLCNELEMNISRIFCDFLNHECHESENKINLLLRDKKVFTVFTYLVQMILFCMKKMMCWCTVIPLLHY